MPETVNLDVTTLEESVSVTTTDGGTVEVSVQAQRGETGATGATGAAGPNSVTSATTTDFTTGQVLYANGTNVGSLSRSGIDTRTTFPNDDVTAATSDGFNNPGKILKTDTPFGFLTVGGLSILGATSSATFDISGLTDDRTYTFPDASGTIALTSDLAPLVINASATATAGRQHINVATATYTDPTPSEGMWYRVIVRNGTATVGGTAYATSGTVIERSYHSGAWANRVYNETPVLGTNVSTALSTAVGSAGAFVVNGGALGTPSSGTLTSCTGLPISTGVSGLGANVATFLATPSSANLAAAVTDETGTGSLVFANSPTIVTPTISRSGNGTVTTFQDGSGKTVTVETASFGTQISINATGGTLGAYATLNGQLESWVNVIAASNTTDLRWMRFGTLSNRFRIDRLNDTATIIRATPFSFANNAPTNSFYMHVSGGVSYGNTTDPGAGNIILNGNQIIIATSQTPASASAAGTAGTICRDADYIYVCTATNTWKRTAISTW